MKGLGRLGFFFGFGLVRWRSHRLEVRNRELEHTVAERTAELRRSIEHLKATQAQLVHSEKMASLGQLTAGIAHEIKNPLNFVNNFAELSSGLAEELADEIETLRDRLGSTADELTELLEDLKLNAVKINEHGRRADRIVQAMLLHSRGSESERRAVEFNDLIEEYVNLAYHGLRAQQVEFNVEIERDYDPGVGKIEVVQQDMGRVLVNLLNNAFYAVHQKAQTDSETFAPRVSIRTCRRNDQVELRLSDNGSGIPEAVRARIFEPFFTTKPTGEGTGLGLSISYDIVAQGHGGTMSVESTEGEGTTFVITLPVV